MLIAADPCQSLPIFSDIAVHYGCEQEAAMPSFWQEMRKVATSISPMTVPNDTSCDVGAYNFVVYFDR